MEQEFAILLRLVIACALGGCIGYERGQTGKAAGVRTHMLIALSAALFVSFTSLFAFATEPLAPVGDEGNFRIQIKPLTTIKAVVTGIGFLGAGIIVVNRQRNKAKYLTTAASLWVTAAIGVAVGLDHYIVAVGGTLLALLILRVVPALGKRNTPNAN